MGAVVALGTGSGFIGSTFTKIGSGLGGCGSGVAFSTVVAGSGVIIGTTPLTASGLGLGVFAVDGLRWISSLQVFLWGGVTSPPETRWETGVNVTVSIGVQGFSISGSFADG